MDMQKRISRVLTLLIAFFAIMMFVGLNSVEAEDPIEVLKTRIQFPENIKATKQSDMKKYLEETLNTINNIDNGKGDKSLQQAMKDKGINIEQLIKWLEEARRVVEEEWDLGEDTDYIDPITQITNLVRNGITENKYNNQEDISMTVLEYQQKYNNIVIKYDNGNITHNEMIAEFQTLIKDMDNYSPTNTDDESTIQEIKRKNRE